MTVSYEINFTYDPLGNRTFQLAPYTTNGTVNPNSNLLDTKATDAATSLLLYGKGSPNYGERMAENMVHLLENFSSDVEPVKPIAGQVWFDTSGTTGQLRVYNPHKHTIVQDASNPTVDFFGLAYDNDSEKNDMIARFSSLQRIRIHDDSSGMQEEYAILTVLSDGDTTGNLITLQVGAPPASRFSGTWNVGGWEYVVQNNTALRGNLDAGADWTIVNLRDTIPSDTDDVVTNKGYVDAAIATAVSANNELGELSDVTITSPTNSDIISYVAGNWVNTDGSTIFVRTDGASTMTGALDMGGQAIINLPPTPGYPSQPHHATSKLYVDQQISAATGGTPTDLNGLTDCTITAPTTDHILVYSAGQWRNFAPNTSPLLARAGDTVTGDFTIAGPSHQDAPGLAATENYVDNQISNLDVNLQLYVQSEIAALPAEDYVLNGSFAPGTQTLTLDRVLGGQVFIDMTGAGGDSSTINHTISDPNTGDISFDVDVQQNGGLAWEEQFYDSATYPNESLNRVLNQVNTLLGRHVEPIQQFTFSSNGNGVIHMGDTSGGAVANQCNPTGTLPYAYVAGNNVLQVYVNGVKYYNSDRGFFSVFGETSGSPLEGFSMFPGTRTGLSAASTYQFSINVNGAGAVTITVPASAANETMGGLCDSINAIADAQYFDSGSPNAQYAFGVRMLGGIMQFFSCLPGTGSSVVVTDTTLFAAIVGDAGSTGAFQISSPLSGGSYDGESPTPDPNYLPVDRGYKEIGRVGKESQVVEFVSGSEPASGAIIEVRIDRDMFGERLA